MPVPGLIQEPSKQKIGGDTQEQVFLKTYSLGDFKQSWVLETLLSDARWSRENLQASQQPMPGQDTQEGKPLPRPPQE